MTSVDEYRLARQAQDARYEALTGLPVDDVWRQEYRDYFGRGDCAGEAVEVRVLYRDWLVGSTAELAPDEADDWETMPEHHLRAWVRAGSGEARGELLRRMADAEYLVDVESTDDVMLDRRAVAVKLGVAPATVSQMMLRSGRYPFPQPDGHVGRSPWWWSSTIDGWLPTRAGKGAGAGRPRGTRKAG